MADPLIQKVIAEVLRQQGADLKPNTGEESKGITASNVNCLKQGVDNDRYQLTNKLIGDILGPQRKQTSTQTLKEAAPTTGRSQLDSKLEISRPQIIHQQIKTNKVREELVGFATGGTVGFVIPNIDVEIRKMMNLNQIDRSIGIISSRVGSAAQIMAVDDAIKKTNSKVVSVQFARDSDGGPGHGVYIILAGTDVADVTRAVEISLERVDDYFAEVHQLTAGTLEIHYTARAAEALKKAFGAKANKAFGILIGAPAGIGLIMSDVAVKTAAVEVTYYSGPSVESAFTNEVWLAFTGDSAAVKNALEAAKDVGLKLLNDYSSQLRR